MKTPLTLLTNSLAITTLAVLTACSSVPVASNVTETDFSVTGGYTDPATKQAYTGSATAAVKYAPQAPSSPNVPTGATATTATAAPSPSKATSSTPSQP